MSADFASLIESADAAVFQVASETTHADRRTLLQLQQIVRDWDPSYVYLEIGSHVGGTLMPHLVDPRCRAALSIDARPHSQLDERGYRYSYEKNSTARMIGTLAGVVPADDLRKLTTFQSDASRLDPSSINMRVRLAFIDAEHTNRAAFRDFIHTLAWLEDNAVVAFHDAPLIFDALSNIEELLRFIGRPFRSFYLPDNVYALALGELGDAAEKALRASAFDAERFIAEARIALWASVAKNVRPQTD
jgi:hypothetical protein